MSNSADESPFSSSNKLASNSPITLKHKGSPNYAISQGSHEN